MSDGPHKSLNMRRAWKRVAERASNAAFDDAERNEALAAALHDDWVTEVPQRLVARLRDIFGDARGALFDELLIKQLEGLRDDITGGPLAIALLDCAMQAAQRGYRGDQALVRAAGDALRQRAESGSRQVEEHSLRASPGQGVEGVRNRIDDAIARLDAAAVARRCIGRDDGKPSRTSRKKTGIDDGVSLA